jgi:hypothetical protein
MTELDRETRAAVEALTYRLKNRDPEVDDEFIAREFMTALRGRGWRPTEARSLASWTHPAGPGSTPPADVLRELRRDLEAKAAAARESEEAAREPEDAA